MNSTLSGQPLLLKSVPGLLGQTGQVDEFWFKYKRWNFTPVSSQQPRRSRVSASASSPMSGYFKLVAQFKRSQLQEMVGSQGAIALPQSTLGQAASFAVDPSTQVDQLKETFLSTISHELRTPISSIKMATQMLTLALSREGLLSQTGNSSLNNNKIAHYLKILNDECNREINLITDLLDLQRLEMATSPINIQPITLESYLQRIIRPFQEQAQTQQQVLNVDLSPHLPVLMSNAQSLERILVELLTNACKYTPVPGTICVRVLLKSSERSSLQTIVFEVCNSGVELPPEHLSRVFDKFYRIPTSDPHKHRGTGLGLALVKRLVTQLGGTIQVDSAAQQTCFSVELPVNSEVRRPSLASVSAPAG